MNHLIDIWKKANLRKKASIIAGLISAIAFTYVGLSEIWNLPFSDEIFRTGKVIVSFISLLLASFTASNLSHEVHLDNFINEESSVGGTSENESDERYGEK